MQLIAVQFGVTADGDLATTFEVGVHRALRRHADLRLAVIERREQFVGGGIALAALDADRALAHGREADGWIEPPAGGFRPCRRRLEVPTRAPLGSASSVA